ncbi:hypothetical protein [Patiriisocius hiemis]|uniref:Lipoprotein n=1 Tax=Patiriisocius hiemis TaxID=3075604 RepID=A0ABU2YAH8_9FLAO|nr:hypothetical protein [Constantimarinum sp. W242]MDT0555198.1 hypothetical protein [Constantimarinum sp. W242]
MNYIKLNLALFFSLTILLNSGCGEKKNSRVKESEKEPYITEEILEEVLDEIQAKQNPITEKLKKLTPLSSTDMDAWMPDKLGNLHRVNYKTNAMPASFTFVTIARFKSLNTSEQLDITLMDGAGPMGSMAIAPFLDLERITRATSTDEGFQKTITKNGTVYIQKYNEQDDTYFLQFTNKDRFIVKIETQNITEKSLWEYASQFHFNALPKI